MTRRHYDPTDAGYTVFTPLMNGVEWLTQLQRLQMVYGICSEPTCQWPIAGWCADDGCRAKLCYDHLAEHRNQHQSPPPVRYHFSAENWADAIEREAEAVEPDDEAAMDDATFQAMIDDEIADEMAAEFFGDDEAAHVAETVGELHETGRE